MSRSSSAPEASGCHDSSDEDEMDLPVIAIDHLRATVHPDQVKNRHEHVAGLVVRGRCVDEAELLFEVDERDPLLSFYNDQQHRQVSPLRSTASPEQQQQVAETAQQEQDDDQSNVAARSETLAGQALEQDHMQKRRQEEEKQYNVTTLQSSLPSLQANQAPETLLQEQQEHEQKHDADSLQRLQVPPVSNTVCHHHDQVASCDEQSQGSKEKRAVKDSAAGLSSPNETTERQVVVHEQEQQVGRNEPVVLHEPQLDDPSLTLRNSNAKSNNSSAKNPFAGPSSMNETAERLVVHEQEQLVGCDEHVVLQEPQVSHDDTSLMLPDNNAKSNNSSAFAGPSSTSETAEGVVLHEQDQQHQVRDERVALQEPQVSHDDMSLMLPDSNTKSNNSSALAGPSSTSETAEGVVLHEQDQQHQVRDERVALQEPQVSLDDTSFSLPENKTNSKKSSTNILNSSLDIVRRVSESSAILAEADVPKPPPARESSNFSQEQQKQQQQQQQDDEDNADDDDDSEVVAALNHQHRDHRHPVHHVLLNDRPVVSPPDYSESSSPTLQQHHSAALPSTTTSCSNNSNSKSPIACADYLPSDEERKYLDRLDEEIYQTEEQDYLDALEASIIRAEEQEQLDAAGGKENVAVVQTQERLLGQEKNQVEHSFEKTKNHLRVLRRYPRFVDTKEMLSRSTVQELLVETGKKYRHDELPKVALQESFSHANTWELAVSGLKHMVDQFLAYVDDSVRCSYLNVNREKLLLTGYKLEAYFNGSEELGATAYQFKYEKNKTAVLWKGRPGKQFSRVLGKEAASLGSLLIAVDGEECTSRDDLKDRITGAEHYCLTLVVSGEADLSLMDKSRIVDGPHALSKRRPQTLTAPTNRMSSTSQRLVHQKEKGTSTPGLVSPLEERLALADKETWSPPQRGPVSKKRNALTDVSTAKSVPRKKARPQVPREGLLTSLIGGLGGFDKVNASSPKRLPTDKAPIPSENSPLVKVGKELGTSVQSQSSSNFPKKNVLAFRQIDPGNQEPVALASSKTQDTSTRHAGSEQAANAASNTFSVRQYPSPISCQSKDSRHFNVHKRVTFSDVVEERQYSFSEAPSELCLSNTKKINIAATGSHNSERRQQSIGSLEKTVREGTHLDLVKFLSQNEQTDFYSEDLFKKMRRIVADLAEKATTSEEKECLVKKEKLLKIYIQAIYVAQQSKFTGKWERFEIKLKGIEGLRLDDPSSALNGRTISGRVFSMKGKAREELHSIPPTPLTFDEKDSSYRLNFDPDMHSYHMNYNDSLSDNRKVKVELRLRGGNAPVPLGSVYIKLSELHKKCPPDREWKHLSVAATSSDTMIEANLNISARRTATDRDMVEVKRRGMLEKLKEVLDWIEQWNLENSLAEHSPAMLSANIRAGEQLSLVHAALYLHDCELMERVLQLGGNSKAAFSLARNMADGTAEAYNEDGNVDPADWKRSRRAIFEKIVALLQHYSHKAAEAQADSGEEPAASKNATDSKDFNDSPAELEAFGGGALMPAEDIALPILPNPTWATTDLKWFWLCKDWEKDHCCSRGTAHCKYLHLHRPWGSKLPELIRNAKAYPLLDYKEYSYKKDCVQIKRDDTLGRLWFTAAYEDRGPGRTNQFIYYAEGGEAARISKQGVSWYPTEENAKAALYNVVEASQWAQRQGITPPEWQTKFNLISGEQNSHFSGKLAGTEYYGPSSTSSSPKPCKSDAGYHGTSLDDTRGDEHSCPYGNCGPSAHSHKRSSPTYRNDWEAAKNIQKVEMPLLDDKWITNFRRKPCRYFPHDCRYGVKCHNAHFFAPMPAIVDYSSLPPFRLDERAVAFLWEANNTNRQKLVTARYWDASHAVYYYAQNGPDAYWDPVNRLWWYTTRSAALNGIMNAIHFAHDCIQIENAKKRQKLH